MGLKAVQSFLDVCGLCMTCRIGKAAPCSVALLGMKSHDGASVSMYYSLNMENSLAEISMDALLLRSWFAPGQTCSRAAVAMACLLFPPRSF